MRAARSPFLGLQDGDEVVFSEVEGMTELNDGKPRRIKNCKVRAAIGWKHACLVPAPCDALPSPSDLGSTQSAWSEGLRGSSGLLALHFRCCV